MKQWLEQIDWARWQAPVMSGVRILVIVLLAWVAVTVLQGLVRALRARLSQRLSDPEAASRAETLSRVVRYLIAVIVGAIASMLVLSEIGISLAPILGAAGVVGVAVGFGAQSLIRDYFTGFFLLFEDQIRTGDVVRIANISGKVEDITLRHVRLRDGDGHVHFVPNSLITTVTNMGRQYSYAVIEIGVGYREDTDRVFEVMRQVGARLREDPKFRPRISEDLEIVGIERLADSAVIVRARFRTPALAQWEVKREYLRRIKKEFDAQGIEIPYPQLTLNPATERDDSAAVPFKVAIER